MHGIIIPQSIPMLHNEMSSDASTCEKTQPNQVSMADIIVQSY